MKSIFFLAAGVLISTGFTMAQTGSPAVIELIQNFEPGKRFTLDIRKGKVDSRQPGTENMRSSTSVELSIKGNAQSREAIWTYGPTVIVGGPPGKTDQQTQNLLNLYKGVQVKFRLDEQGQIQELTNFEECKKQLAKGMELTFANASRTITPEEKKQMTESLKPSFVSPDVLLGTYFPELQGYFSMFGAVLLSDSVYNSPAEIPNPFGGRSFPATQRTKVEEITNAVATISVQQIIPKEDLQSIMKETFIELAKSTGKPFEESEVPKVNFMAKSVFSYDYKNKVLKEVFTEKQIEADGVKQTQTLQVILMK